MKTIFVPIIAALFMFLFWMSYPYERKRVKSSPISNKLKAFDKTMRVIKSCKTGPQLMCADHMIDFYNNLYGQTGEDVYLKELNMLFLIKLDQVV